MKSKDFYKVIDAAIAEIGKDGVLKKLSARILPVEMLSWAMLEDVTERRPAVGKDREAMVKILRYRKLEHVDPDLLFHRLHLVRREADNPDEAVPLLARHYSLLKAERTSKPRSDNAERNRFIWDCLLHLFGESEEVTENKIRLRLMAR
jgi:hypothetical protein